MQHLFVRIELNFKANWTPTPKQVLQKSYLVPFMSVEHPTRGLLMQYRASTHTYKLAMELVMEVDIESLGWRSRSPDMNPIENIWRCVLLAWAELGEETIPALVNSMAGRCITVIERKGWKTKY